MAKKKLKNETAALDMTPMIDVVFELIIFFVVTLKMSDDKDMSIDLENGKHGITITHDEAELSDLTIDISERSRSLRPWGKNRPAYDSSKKGRISVNNLELDDKQLDQLIKRRVDRFGTEFHCFIRADGNALHEDVRRVMDICSGNGVWKLSIVAMQKKGNKDS